MREDDTKYVSKDEAIFAARDYINDYTGNNLCPLLKGNCSPDCVCFKRPVPFKEGRARKWTLSNWGCTNPMLGQGGTSGGE